MSCRSFRKKFLTFLTVILVIGLVSCKKDEKKVGDATQELETLGKPASPTKSATVPLYASLPADVTAFFNIDLQGAAFERLLSSKWGKSYLTKTSTITSEIPDLAAVMAEAGVDLSKPEELRKELSEVLLLLAAIDQTSQGHGAIILRSTSEPKTRALFNALSEAIKKRGGTADAEEFTMPTTITFGSKPASDGLQRVRKVNIIGKLGSDRILIGDDPELLKNLVDPKVIFTSPEVSSIASAADGNSIGIGFFDFKKLKTASKEDESIPVKVGVVSAQMSDHPTIQVKLVKDKAGSGTPSAATSKVILSSIPNDPLLYTIIEAGAIRDIAAKSSAKVEEAMNDTQLSFVKSLGQVGIGAKVSSDVHAIIPIPELIVSVQTADSKGLIERIMQSASGAVKGYGLPGITTDKQIAGKSVKFLQGAMGVNLYVADLGDAVVVSTAEPLISAAIERNSGKGPINNIANSGTGELAKPAMAKLYLSFPELAKFLKSAQSMAGAAGGSSRQANQMSSALSDENLKILEDLGTLVGSIGSNNETYDINISYN